ncbi:hypothetical protein [Silvibacterium sp.]|uniref:hypothetical protein n=1 Tax=Silvibacterium sp. TaxID=1964179 RepID=UPI0039E60129
MELETGEILGTITEAMERLNAAAATLERAASAASAVMEERTAAAGELSRMVATVEGVEPTLRERELEHRLAVAEQRIAELSAQETNPAPVTAAVRKTLPAATVQLLAKQGIASFEGLEAGALDAALAGLSLEQRIAVKSQLLRAGALS